MVPAWRHFLQPSCGLSPNLTLFLVKSETEGGPYNSKSPFSYLSLLVRTRPP